MLVEIGIGQGAKVGEQVISHIPLHLPGSAEDAEPPADAPGKHDGCQHGHAQHKAAQRLRFRLGSGIRSLSSMPHRYPFFNEPYIPANKYHKLYVENWFLVLYQIKDDTVFVDWIVDVRQDYQWLLK